MRTLRYILSVKILMSGLLLATSCMATTNNLSSPETFVGSTAGGEEIKSLLTIRPETPVDFIRWNVVLTPKKAGSGTFALKISYGESQPNTLGFKKGEQLSFDGVYVVSNGSEEQPNWEIYHLKADKLPAGLSMVKMSENILHLITSQKRLMVGNGGWSYTLNRYKPLNDVSAKLTASDPGGQPANAAPQTVFDGRTPCREIATEYNIDVTPDCFKMKWRIIFNRDPKTLSPTTYQIKRINHRETYLSGSWVIRKGTPSNPGSVIYQLDPDKPDGSISLFAADDNVLFFLRKNGQMFTGNEDFSFTLNKKE